MAKGAEVLTMLIPTGGWVITGDEYENIQFLECEAITKEEFKAGFAQFDILKAEQDASRATAKTSILSKLEITEEEVALLLS